MTGFFRFLLVSLAFTLGTTNLTHAASFDCSKATTETEIAICNDPELNEADMLLGQSLKNLIEKFPNDEERILIDQNKWIQTQNSCAGNLNCLNWIYSDWFSKYTWNMSFADFVGISTPEIDPEANKIKFDHRTCEFSEVGEEEYYNCSSSLKSWDRVFKSCSFSGYVLQTKKTVSGVDLLLWNSDFSYFSGKQPNNVIKLNYGSGGNPFRFWIEGNIASTSLNTLGDEIYIGSPRSFSGDAAIYKLGDGSSDWDYYDQHFSNLIPKMTMLLIMIDDQIPINCVGLQEPVL